MARYIDADKMRKEWLENGENEFIYDTNSVLDSIDSQPTADVVPVKHGEWNTTDTPLGMCCVCSVCGSCPTMEYNYCPYCGAKMDGGKG